jgi:hypothetical protein
MPGICSGRAVAGTVPPDARQAVRFRLLLWAVPLPTESGCWDFRFPGTVWDLRTVEGFCPLPVQSSRTTAGPPPRSSSDTEPLAL